MVSTYNISKQPHIVMIKKCIQFKNVIYVPYKDAYIVETYIVSL